MASTKGIRGRFDRVNNFHGAQVVHMYFTIQNNYEPLPVHMYRENLGGKVQFADNRLSFGIDDL